MDGAVVPVVLFAYARPRHLRRTLACLRENQVPKLCIFSDGPRTPDQEPAVAEVRRILRAIDWCDVEIVERPENLGLGRSILAGVSAALQQHEAVIVFEDDLICVPGTYQYLCAALRHYRNEPGVMSVTGWTHPKIHPVWGSDQPYFDDRAECWVWATWARSWRGMERDARTLMEECQRLGLDVYRYGEDLPAMAQVELQQNLWAVRFLFHHMLHQGLCLRPPWSMVEHIGFDELGTNARNGNVWSNPPLRPSPPMPAVWPEVREHPACAALWRQACGLPAAREKGSLHRMMVRIKKRLGPLAGAKAGGG